jgi:hypothetical protein
MFNTKLIDKFYEALFCTDFKDYASATQNEKTDCLAECKDFDEWLDRLINVFADEEEVNAADVRTAALADKKFIETMKAEYEELLELCDDEDEDEEEEFFDPDGRRSEMPWDYGRHFDDEDDEEDLNDED